MSVDVVDRSVDPSTGIIRTERILGCKQRAPTWIVKLFGGSEDAFVREISFVDPTSQTTTISSVNLSLAQFAVCNEMIRYSPNGKERTTFEQTAEIETRVEMWRKEDGAALLDGVDWVVGAFLGLCVNFLTLLSVSSASVAVVARARCPSSRAEAILHSHLPIPSTQETHDTALASIRQYLKGRTSYDTFPISFRLIVLDSKLEVRKALQCLLHNGSSYFTSFSGSPHKILF